MLRVIELECYRCYDKSKIAFKELCIIVGSNNAGKSTIIEALRILANVVSRYQYAIYSKVPRSHQYENNSKAIKVDCQKLKIDLRSIVNFYRSEVATITASFDGKAKVVVKLNKEGAYAFIIDKNGNVITRRGEASNIHLSTISIMPPISMVRELEKKYSDEVIESNFETYLSSKHFRNELYYMKDEKYNKFKKLAEKTWQGLKIIHIKEFIESGDEVIELMVEENRFPGEVRFMGSGLQMWLQIIWFIVKSEGSETIILDEPDIYMHPDLQIKILKLVRHMFKQVIIATHSIEIISEVEPSSIIMINKNTRKMEYANALSAVQNIVNTLGSVHNISLIRLGTLKKCLFVEGKDVKYLNKFYNILYPKSTDSLETLPNIALGGWTRFNEALGTARLFYKETKGVIKTLCILDRDYHSGNEVENLYKKAEENHLDLFVWNKKEIENYFLIPSVIYKTIKKKKIKYDVFIKDLDTLIDSMKDDTIDSYATQISQNDKGKTVSNCNKEARLVVSDKWTTLESKLSIVNGKKALSLISSWMQEKLNQDCSISAIVKYMKTEDINDDIVHVIDKLIG